MITARADADAAKVRSILKTELVPVNAGHARPDVTESRRAQTGA